MPQLGRKMCVTPSEWNFQLFNDRNDNFEWSEKWKRKSGEPLDVLQNIHTLAIRQNIHTLPAKVFRPLCGKGEVNQQMWWWWKILRKQRKILWKIFQHTHKNMWFSLLWVLRTTFKSKKNCKTLFLAFIFLHFFFGADIFGSAKEIVPNKRWDDNEI